MNKYLNPSRLSDMKKFLCHVFVYRYIISEASYIGINKCKMGLGLKRTNFAPGVNRRAHLAPPSRFLGFPLPRPLFPRPRPPRPRFSRFPKSLFISHRLTKNNKFLVRFQKKIFTKSSDVIFFLFSSFKILLDYFLPSL